MTMAAAPKISPAPKPLPTSPPPGFGIPEKRGRTADDPSPLRAAALGLVADIADSYLVDVIEGGGAQRRAVRVEYAREVHGGTLHRGEHGAPRVGVADVRTRAHPGAGDR